MRRRRNLVVTTSATLLALAVAACASGGARSRTSECQIEARDSVYLVRGPVYRACSVTVRATRVAVGSRPDWHPVTHRDGCFSTDIQLVVDSTGRPERNTARVVRTSDRDLGEALLATVDSWRYDPATRNGVPVRQIVTEHDAIVTATVVVPMSSGPPVGRPPSSPVPPC